MEKEKKKTKQRIIEEALDLFSKKGFESTSVEEIAVKVGIKAPSLYKHFKSKQDIFDSIFSEMERRFELDTEGMYMSDLHSDIELFLTSTEEVMIKKMKEFLIYAIHDEYVSKFRKLLTIEQFCEKQFAELYSARYLDYMFFYHKSIFSRLIEEKFFVPEDPQIMAVQFVGPIITMIMAADRKPEKDFEAIEVIESHILQFLRMYKSV